MLDQSDVVSAITECRLATSVFAVAATALVGDHGHKAYIQIGQDFVRGFAGLLQGSRQSVETHYARTRLSDGCLPHRSVVKGTVGTRGASQPLPARRGDLGHG